VEVLSIEILWAQKTTTISSDLPIVHAIESSLKHRLAQVVDVVKKFSSLNGILSFTSAYKTFSSGLSSDDLFRQSHPSNVAVFLNIMAGPSFYLGDCDFFVASNGYDCVAASQWFASLSNDDGKSAQGSTCELFSTYTVLSDELRCLSSFGVFAHVFSLLLKKWRSESPDSSLLEMPKHDFALSIAREILNAFDKNLIDVEFTQLQVCPSWLSNEALTLSKELSGLVLAYLCIEGLAWDLPLESWVEVMGLLAEIAKKVYQVTQAQTDVCTSGFSCLQWP
jgi:hypothetical protein